MGLAEGPLLRKHVSETKQASAHAAAYEAQGALSHTAYNWRPTCGPAVMPADMQKVEIPVSEFMQLSKLARSQYN